MSDRAELSSMAATLADLTDRVAHIAQRHVSDEHGNLSANLYEVERSLRTALRRLERAADQRDE